MFQFLVPRQDENTVGGDLAINERRDIKHWE